GGHAAVRRADQGSLVEGKAAAARGEWTTAAKFFRCDPEGPGAILESSVRVFVFALRNSRLSAGCKPSAEQFGGPGDCRNAAAAALAVELVDEIDHRGGIFDRVGTRQAEAGLHHHQRELLERAARGVGVDRREAARV